MLSSRNILLLVVVVVLAVFLAGLMQLFKLRLEAGDVYPPYSSLRADPLGTKAFHDSLASLPDVSVQRFYDPLLKLPTGEGTTFFIFGLNAFEATFASEKEDEQIERFLREGGRLVVTFFPENSKTWESRKKERESKKKIESKESRKSEDKETEETEKKDEETKAKAEQPQNPVKKKKPVDEDLEEFFGKWVSLKDKWGFSFDYLALDTDEEGVAVPVTVERAEESLSIPPELDWYTAVYFTDLTNSWRPLYLREEDPVFIERDYGKGTIVLCSDSYFLSNEALRDKRHPDLLAWLVGNSEKVIFSETHLGVVSQPGIAALVRKYRLHGLVIGLVFLAGLFVWKNMLSFVPPHQDELERDAVVAGKDSAAGFVNLLRRGVGRGELLAICLAEWKKTNPRNHGSFKEKNQRVEALVQEELAKPVHERNTVETYRRIAQILAERK